MNPTALVAGGSLVAILFLAWLAMRLGLGGAPRIRDEVHVRELADEAMCGFSPVEIAIDREGAAALARDGDGRIMIVRRHGAHFAARLLDSSASAHLEAGRLVVSSGERRFGATSLDLDDGAPRWAAKLARR